MRTAGIGAESGPPADLEHAVLPAMPEPSAPAQRRPRDLSPALLLSLALHLLPLLLLVHWHEAPVEVPTPIPVRLVMEQPPPPPEPVVQKETPAKPLQGPLASEEVGAPADKREPSNTATAQTPEPQAAPDPGRPIQTSSEPDLRQVASLAPPDQEPTLLDREALALPAPELEPLPDKPAEPATSRRPAPRPRPPQREAAITGPPAARDEYLARLVTLVRPYLRLLPPELLNGRRGMTSLGILVLGDGTIARITVAQSSGYPDIDTRVIEMIAAIGHFPPLPPWIDQPSWEINFHLRFPFAQVESERR